MSKSKILAQSRTQLLRQALRERVLVLDGAMGTAIQSRHLVAQDFSTIPGDLEREGCNENLVLSRPDIISEIHEEYLRAGCDIVETNTFGATSIVLEDYGLASQTRAINLKAAELARAACEKYSSPAQPRFVAGSVGPTTKAISVTGGITFPELVATFAEQILALTEAGVDFLLLETCQDTRNIKAALCACDEIFEKLGTQIPIAISATIEPTGTMLGGQNVESLLASLAHRDLLYIGLNCATGPEFMTDHIRSLAKLAPFPIACVPNAGLPDENGCYLESPAMVSQILERFLNQGWINLIGGCCGTHAGHIQALRALASRQKPRLPNPEKKSVLSGIDILEITDEIRPVIVGERTNVIGSKKFKTLICEEKFEEASEIARAQIKRGAQIVDICLANPDRDERVDTEKFLSIAAKKIRAPLMIDSTDAQVVEMALTYCQGKSIINSINLEDGEDRFAEIIPLAKKYGAALVVGTIDDDPDQGMGVTRARKLAIAEREYDLLTKKYKIAPEDIYWDPLVFPCATGDAQYLGSALETIEGIRLIKEKFPRTRTVLGISNVSFGLPGSGREVLNSVFLHHCCAAGLDLAIVNAEKLERYATLPAQEIQLAEDLIFNRGKDPVGAFTAFFRALGKDFSSTRAQIHKPKLPLLERIPRYIIEGSKDGLTQDLTEAMQTLKPLDIINGPLMAGMDEVGRLFNASKMIVAEVLQSAEAMKAAVAFLEPHMEQSQSISRGKILLATVKGDVHDIGKNLVEIILSNNGFEVVNLGIKIPPEQLIQAIRDHKPQMVGLSGLLVKSAHQMVATVEDFAQAGIATPVLVGGAALSENFVDRNIATAYKTGTVTYASDAMSGLDLAKKIVDEKQFAQLKDQLTAKRAEKALKPSLMMPVRPAATETRSKLVSQSNDLPPVQDLSRHVIRAAPIEPIWKYINPLMLYGRHLGIRGGVVRKLEHLRGGAATFTAAEKSLREELRNQEPKSLQIWEAVQEVMEDYRGTDILRASAVFQFFPCQSRGNRIELFNADGTQILENLHFQRQRKEEGLSLADYAHPAQNGAPLDSLAAFVVTVGKGVREIAENLKNRGDYLKSHIIQALAIESAEAYAEHLHSRIRAMWGFPDPPEMTMLERFQAKYRGKRYSFGYPACPRLDDQEILWRLLSPGEIGVKLTEGFMMDPESSVSALVFHHPECSYFSVGGGVDDNRT